jgi:hypothetical protein
MPLGLMMGMGLGHNGAASGGGGGGGSGATWNPSDKSADIALSGGNLIAARASGAGSAGVRATVGKTTSGSFKVTIDNIGTGGCQVGLANLTFPTNDFGGNTNSIGYLHDGRIFFNGASLQTGLASYTTGDQIQCDFDGTNASFKKNGAAVGTPVDIHATIPTAYPLGVAGGTSAQFTLDATGW